jgi:hypothetical protein
MMPQHFSSNGSELSFKYAFLFIFLKDSNVLMDETVPMERRYSFFRLVIVLLLLSEVVLVEDDVAAVDRGFGILK